MIDDLGINVGNLARHHGIEPVNTASRGIMGQLRGWMQKNSLSEGAELFPSGEENKAAEELFSTWTSLEPYSDELERFRHLRGDRAIGHVGG